MVVLDEDCAYLLAGDATYSQENLRAGHIDGVTNDAATGPGTLRWIKEFAALPADGDPAGA